MSARIKAVLGPTNTGKTHYAIERMCAHASGIMGFPLRLLAREAYDRVVRIKGEASVGLITGEERIVPPTARWLMCTAESMPIDRDAAFAAIDEVQIAADPERGHIFTDRMLHVRGREETLILGSQPMAGIVRHLVPEAEISGRPRFSQLRYAAPLKLSRLPIRSAIIAFSADDVYEIAEELRRTRGGAAIVMGNLSPHTRNAQVSMYQSGEVDFIVATDAVGMGVNMDVDHVAFASVTKFDGKRMRRLRIDELAQIAGRAGRHHRNGSFGTLVRGDNPIELTPEEIERIEDHRFTKREWIYWRSRDLDFTDPDALIASLTAIPSDPALRAAPPADDLLVLRALADDPALSAQRWSETTTARLWDACSLPDFRNAGPEHHARLVQRIHGFIGRGSGRIPEAVLLNETARLDSLGGDIGALASRLAGIRTWAYAANRSDWVEHPANWAERTRDIERRLSETLHQRLVERFVERRASRLARGGFVEASPRDVRIAHDRVIVLGEDIGRVEGLRLIVDRLGADAGQRALIACAERYWKAHVAARASELAQADYSEFAVLTPNGTTPKLVCRGVTIARIERGKSLVSPAVHLVTELSLVEPALRDACLSRAREAMMTILHRKLGPLFQMHATAFDPATPAAIRALLAALSEDGGYGTRKAHDATIRLLSPDDRRRLRRMGITIGSLGIFHPGLLKPEAIRLRLALLAAYRKTPMPPLPMPALTLIDCPAPPLAEAVAKAGFVGLGDAWLRADLAERIARVLHQQRLSSSEFVPDSQLATSIGLGRTTYSAMLRLLGFVPAGDHAPGRWKWRTRPMPPGGRRKRSAERKAKQA